MDNARKTKFGPKMFFLVVVYSCKKVHNLLQILLVTS